MGSKAEILQDISTAIRNNINDAAHSFVSTGFYLKQVRDEKLFGELGYKDIWEYANEEFGISKSNASRFMSINDKFSIDGNSTTLLEQYNNFSYSKLQEMLTLDEEQLNNITEDMTVKQIREIKKAESEENNDVDEETEMEVVVQIEDENTHQENDEDIKVNLDMNDYQDENDIDYEEQEIEERKEENIEHVTGEVVKTVVLAQQDVTIQEEKHSIFCKDFGYECNLDERRDLVEEVGINCTASCCRKCEFVSQCGYRCLVAAEHIDKDKAPEGEEQPDTLLKNETKAQVELPVLRNNDQRKEWVENYRTWLIWLEVEQTGERYYRYDFENGVSFVIKDDLRHFWKMSGYSNEPEYMTSEYYILGREEKEKYRPKNPTFYECKTNKTDMIDYLKEFQKK